MKSPIKLTEADVANCQWTFDRVEGGYRFWIGHGTHPVTGVEITVEKKEPVFVDDLVTLNTEERNARDGKRWGSGTGSEKSGNMPMIRVARTPLNKLYADAAPYIRQGDDDHMRWLLNSEAYAPFRTRTGRL